MRHVLLVSCPFVLSAAVARAQGTAAVPDTRGPVVSTGMNVVADAEGVRAPGYRFGGIEAPAWSAKWIAPAPPAPRDVAATLLRKEIALDAAPDRVRAWVTAGEYRMWVNGTLASRGPADFGSDFTGASSGKWFYDGRDLTRLFHAGKNVVAVEMSGGPGLLFQAEVSAGGKKTTIASDPTWRSTPASFLTKPSAPAARPTTRPDPLTRNLRLTFDGNLEPVGWQLAGFDDAAWAACQAVDAPRRPLEPSQLPPCMEARYPVASVTRASGEVDVPEHPFGEGHPVTVRGDGDFAVHFGRVTAARCGIAVRGGKGARVYLSSNELDAPGGRTYAMTLRDGVQYFEPPDFYAVGTIRVAVREAGGAPVEVLDVSADATSQPVDYAGSFECSDERLNRLWKSLRWSTQICLQTHHLDSPHNQEPISDYGDYLIEDLAGFDAFGCGGDGGAGGNVWLARQDLRKWAWVMAGAKYQTFHTSYALLWLQALLNFYDRTGDAALVRELSPQAFALLERFAGYVGKNGLVSEAPNYMFMDWVTIAGFPCHHPPAVIGQGYLTAFYYRALADGIRVAELAGDAPRAARYAELRGRIKTAYERELWDAGKGLYRDGRPFQTTVPPNKWLPADKAIETFSVQNNALAVLYDLAPADRQAAVVDRMMATEPTNVRPYFMHFVLDAVAHAGRFDAYAAERMRKWTIVPETQTVREMGDTGDYSHGWIATPLVQMSSRVLGVTPASPGYDAISVRPSLADLTFAKGVVPTPHGSVAVAWAREGGRLTLDVTVPAGATAAVDVPTANAAAVTLWANDKVIWDAGAPTAETVAGVGTPRGAAGAVQVPLAAGSYRLAMATH